MTGARNGERGLKRDADLLGAAYLCTLGARVRAARARRGMTRRILARDSGVSERYLAQLEAGHGNPSMIVLRRIAAAMDLPLGDLVTDDPARPVEATLALQLLQRLTPEQQSEARRLLQERFGEPGGGERRGRIALIGLRGAGKSTLGRRLAQHLRVPFIELNAVIAQDYGAPISELLALSGQPAYRRHERRSLEAVTRANEEAVIATGGSLVSDPATFDRLLATCTCIWVKAAPEEHMSRVIAQGDLRPMADNHEAMDDLRQILAAREPYYSRADAVLDTAGKSADESFAELIALVERSSVPA